MSAVTDHGPTVEHDARTLAASLLAGWEQAWNRADGEAFGATFAEDADFVDVRHDHHHGRREVAEGHQAIFDTIYAGSTVRYELESARTIAPGCVLAIGRGILDAPAGPLRGVNECRFSFTVVDAGERWEVASFQNTLRPPAR